MRRVLGICAAVAMVTAAGCGQTPQQEAAALLNELADCMNESREVLIESLTEGVSTGDSPGDPLDVCGGLDGRDVSPEAQAVIESIGEEYLGPQIMNAVLGMAGAGMVAAFGGDDTMALLRPAATGAVDSIISAIEESAERALEAD